MPLAELFTNTATIGTTEYSLPNNSTTLTPRTEDGMYQALIDLNAMAAGDQYEIKIYEKITSGGTQRAVFSATVTGVQSPFIIPALMLLHGWDITMKKLAGTDRSISWSIRQAT